MNNDLAKVFTRTDRSRRLRSKLLLSPDDFVCTEWIRVFTFGDGTMVCGLCENGEWVVETAEGIRSLFDGKSIYLAFCLLEEDPIKFILRFKQEAEQVKIGRSAVDHFPISKLLAGALTSDGSTHWAQAAISWITNLPDSCLTEDVREAVLFAAQRRSSSQNLRHELRKLQKSRFSHLSQVNI